MKHLFFIGLTIICLTIGWNCTDIFVPNIEEEQVTLVLPLHQQIIKQSAVAFKWRFLADAESYHLQVVQPDFDSVENLAVDMFIDTNEVTLTLEEGNYEWNVVAFNAGFQSDCCETRTLTVDAIPDTNIQLILPEDAAHISMAQRNPDFLWQLTENMTTLVQLNIYTDSDQTEILLQRNIDQSEYNLTSTEEQRLTTGNTYYWNIATLDALGNPSMLSELRTFIVQ